MDNRPRKEAASDSASAGILAGTLVVELASVLAGPSVGQFLAELGARVIKVERPDGGDVTRSWIAPGQDPTATSAYFASCNYGKESIALDVREDASRRLLHCLTDAADIVTMSFRQGAAERLGIGAESLVERNPRLVVGRISGYGSDNRRPGYDAVVQAESGFMSINGTSESGPTKMPVALIDILAAHQLKEGILVALLNRQSTGRGAIVDVSLIDAAVASLANQATNYLATGRIPQPMGSAHPNIAPYGSVFNTGSDEPLVLAVGTNDQFFALCSVLALDELAGDSRFETNERRVANRESLERELGAAMLKRRREDLLESLESAGVPAGAVHNLQEVFRSDAGARMVLGDDPDTANPPGLRQVAFTGSTRRSLRPPPELGQDTHAVLSELCKASPADLQSVGVSGAGGADRAGGAGGAGGGTNEPV